jgi:hypothetical protein
LFGLRHIVNCIPYKCNGLFVLERL